MRWSVMARMDVMVETASKGCRAKMVRPVRLVRRALTAMMVRMARLVLPGRLGKTVRVAPLRRVAIATQSPALGVTRLR